MNILVHKRNYTKIAFLVLFLLGIGFPGKAGDTLKTRFLSLDSAVSLGIIHSHHVELSNSQLKEIHSSFEDIKNRAIPSVSVSAGYTRLSDIPVEYLHFPGNPVAIPSTAIFPIILNDYSSSASVQESLFNGFLLKYATLNLEYSEKSAQSSLENKKKDVALTIINTYLTLFKLQQAHYLVKQSLDQIAAHVKEVSDFAEHGLATQNDVLRVKLEESNTELSEIDIRNQLQTVNYNLTIMLGISDNVNIEVDSNTILESKIIQPLPYYLQKSLDSRDDLKASEFQKKAAEAGIKQSESDLYPRLNLFGDFYYLRPNPRIVPPLDQFQSTWDVGFSISYNLTNLYSNKNRTDVSRAKFAEAQANYDQLSDNVKIEINQSYLQYTQSLQKIGVAEKSMEQAKENYKIVKSRYDNHISLLTDLMDANNYLLNARINYISSKADAQLAYYNLLKSAGELNLKK